MNRTIPIIVMAVMVLLVVGGWWYMNSVFSTSTENPTPDATAQTPQLSSAKVSKVLDEIKVQLQGLSAYGAQVPITVKDVPRQSEFPISSSTGN